VPEFADWAAVELFEPGGGVRQVPSGEAPPDSGATSRLTVPLTLGERRIGSMTFVSADGSRTYGDADLPVALELAERCSQALHNAQLYDEATSSRALLDTLFATAPVGLCVLDTSMRFLLINERMAELTGRSPAEHLGRRMDEMYAGERGTATTLIHSVLSTGEAVHDVEIVAGARAFLASYAPVTAEGRTLGVICAVVETTERHRVQAERDRMHDRTARLQEVTERLSAALTGDEVADVILSAGMAATGATGGVLALRDGADLVVGHRVGMGGAAAPMRLGLGLEMPLAIAARTAQPVLLPSRDAWLSRMAHPPPSDFEAFAAVPLRFEGGVPGVMGLAFAGRRDFDTADVALLDAIARQGAQALERARLYEERAYVARTLQRGLLPREVPAIAGLDVAVRYRPIGDGSEVGGDFYDVFAAADGWLVAVGDVCGKGTEAAMLTGVVRNTIRALAVRDTEPAAIVAGVNEALLREGSPHALSSVACGSVRRAAGGFVVTLAAGGHPRPSCDVPGGRSSRWPREARCSASSGAPASSRSRSGWPPATCSSSTPTASSTLAAPARRRSARRDSPRCSPPRSPTRRRRSAPSTARCARTRRARRATTRRCWRCASSGARAAAYAACSTTRPRRSVWSVPPHRRQLRPARTASSAS
jgi:PAS domain S-box-containing protein